MNFLRECADRLDDGTSADIVLARMRERYTTPTCLSVKTCLVRKMCAPTRAFTLALDEAVAKETCSDIAEELRRLAISDCRRSSDAHIHGVLQGLPPRLPPNVHALRIGRDESRACKRQKHAACLNKNRVRVRVPGRKLLEFARDSLVQASTVADLALAMLLLTGRRTCELLNGRSTLTPADDAVYAATFTGQAKRRGAAVAYRIPLLAPVEDVQQGLCRLRALQGNIQLSNRETSRRYQSLLSRRIREGAFAAVGHVHGLRGVYDCMCLRLFDFGDPTDSYASMSILGHRDLSESLAYTVYELGREFSEEPSLGAALVECQQEEEGPTENA